MVAMRPDRLGHCVLMHHDEEAWRCLLESGVPVEVCLSSNVATGSVPSVAAHNARALLAAGHPISLCTDDKALFDTTSSQEHWLAATNFGLSRRQVFELSRAASLQAFAEPEVAERLAR